MHLRMVTLPGALPALAIVTTVGISSGKNCHHLIVTLFLSGSVTFPFSLLFLLLSQHIQRTFKCQQQVDGLHFHIQLLQTILSLAAKSFCAAGKNLDKVLAFYSGNQAPRP